MITDVGTAAIATTFIMLLKYISQDDTAGMFDYSNKRILDCKKPTVVVKIPDDKKIPDEKKDDKPSALSGIDPSILNSNAEHLEDVMHPQALTADTMIMTSSITSGLKDKKAKEIRSHWNTNNWKKYYDYELDIHDQENRDWWTNDDYELSKKHVVI